MPGNTEKGLCGYSKLQLIFGEQSFCRNRCSDKFSDVLVIQSLALGMDRMKEVIVEGTAKQRFWRMESGSAASMREAMRKEREKRGHGKG